MTLKRKLSMILILTLGVLVVLFYFAYNRLSSNILSKTGTMLIRKQLQYNRERVLHPLMRELALAQKLASSPLLIDWAEHPESSCKNAGKRELNSFRRFFSDKSCFFAIKSSKKYYFCDSSSKNKGPEFRYSLDPKNPENRWFFATMESGASYRLNVDYDEKLKLTKIWINVVVSKNKEPLGVVGTGLNLTSFIKKVIYSTQSGLINILLEQDGAIQADTDLNRIDFRSISKSPGNRKTIFMILDRPEDKARLKKAMLQAGKDDTLTPVLWVKINDRPYLMGISYIKPIGWYTVSMMNVNKVVGKDRLLPFAGLLIFLLLAFSLVTYLLLDKMMLTRIERLENAVRNFEQWQLPEYPDSSLNDEVGNLETGFKAMAKIVKTKHEELESMVQDRTLELETKNIDLEKAMREIKVLSGLLPICSYCKSIRDDAGKWHPMESYVSKRTEARFSHGICPGCLKEHHPKYHNKIVNK